MNLEEAIKLLKQEPDFSLSYYKREYAIDLLLKAYEKQQKIIEGIVDLMYYTNEYPENIYCMIEDFLKEYGIERKYYNDNI